MRDFFSVIVAYLIPKNEARAVGQASPNSLTYLAKSKALKDINYGLNTLGRFVI